MLRSDTSTSHHLHFCSPLRVRVCEFCFCSVLAALEITSRMQCSVRALWLCTVHVRAERPRAACVRSAGATTNRQRAEMSTTTRPRAAKRSRNISQNKFHIRRGAHTQHTHTPVCTKHTYARARAFSINIACACGRSSGDGDGGADVPAIYSAHTVYAVEQCFASAYRRLCFGRACTKRIARPVDNRLRCAAAAADAFFSFSRPVRPMRGPTVRFACVSSIRSVVCVFVFFEFQAGTHAPAVQWCAHAIVCAVAVSQSLLCS